MFKRHLISLVVIVLSSTSAAARTIDFEESFPYVGSDVGYGYDAVESHGFTIRNFNGVEFTQGPNTEGFFIENGFGENGSRGLAYCPWCTLVLEESSGSLFSLTSVYTSSRSNLPYTVTGFLADGGQVQLVATGLEETLEFDEQWSGLIRLEFGNSGSEGTGQEIDNIVLTTVPIPAAAWLFGTAIAGLGWIRRKQTA
jgi:hypothetical protein